MTKWEDFAACRDADRDLFFPPPSASRSFSRKALEFCRVCLVRQECFRFGYETNQVGIWGGTIQRERNRVRNLRDMARGEGEKCSMSIEA